MPPIAAEKRYAAKVVRLLKKAYPDAVCALNFRTPLELLIATILSAQCTDRRVNLVTKDLFRKYRSAGDYATAEPAELEADIKSTGFYKSKAKSIRTGCQALVEQYQAKVPADMEKLVQLPGVGRKTANVVLGTAFGIASGIVVDTHVTRISQRLGLTAEKNAEKIEQDLMRLVPQREWIALAHRLIHHGRQCCTARSPECDVCPLGSICPRIDVEK